MKISFLVWMTLMRIVVVVETQFITAGFTEKTVILLLYHEPNCGDE
jgi:hypothetical protein